MGGLLFFFSLGSKVGNIRSSDLRHFLGGLMGGKKATGEMADYGGVLSGK